MHFIQEGQTPLFITNVKEIAEVLLAAGANVNHQDKVLSSAQLISCSVACFYIVFVVLSFSLSVFSVPSLL